MKAAGNEPFAVQQARITLFGYAPTQPDLRVVGRSRRWRMIRALPGLALLFLGTPLAALIPPHAPWAAGALIGGLVLARRRWRERYTIQRMEGRCPGCGDDLELDESVALKQPHHLHCHTCNHEPLLEADL